MVDVSVRDVWAVAQDPEAVSEALALAREVNDRLGEASDAVARACAGMAGLAPRSAVRGRTILGRIGDERDRLRPVLRRLRCLTGEGVVS